MSGSGDLGMENEVMKGIGIGLGGILVCVIIGSLIGSALSHPPEHVEGHDVKPPVTERAVDKGETSEAKGNLAPKVGDKQAKEDALGHEEPSDVKMKLDGAKNSPGAETTTPEDVQKKLENAPK